MALVVFLNNIQRDLLVHCITQENLSSTMICLFLDCEEVCFGVCNCAKYWFLALGDDAVANRLDERDQ